MDAGFLQIQLQVVKPAADLTGFADAPLAVYGQALAGIEKGRHGFVNIAASARTERNNQLSCQVIALKEGVD